MKHYIKHKLRSKNPLKVVGIILLFAMGLVAFIAAFGYIVMLLWNWLVPDVFGLTTITFLQAVGLTALCKLLFGGLGSGDHKSKKKKKCREHKPKRDFSKWQLYDQYWKEEGDAAFNDFVARSKTSPDSNA